MSLQLHSKYVIIQFFSTVLLLCLFVFSPVSISISTTKDDSLIHTQISKKPISTFVLHCTEFYLSLDYSNPMPLYLLSIVSKCGKDFTTNLDLKPRKEILHSTGTRSKITLVSFTKSCVRPSCILFMQIVHPNHKKINKFNPLILHFLTKTRRKRLEI